MRVSYLISACAALASASPSSGGYAHCLTDKEANEIVKAVTVIFGENNEKPLILKYIAPDFHQYSDSTIDASPNAPPLGTAITTSRKQFIKQRQGAGAGEFTVLDTFHSCDKIAFRWILAGSPNDVRGIDTLDLVYSGGRWQVSADYSEFNNVGLLQNFGFCEAECPASKKSSP